MMDGYGFAGLSAEDRRRIEALERDLGRKYNREVILIAYEKAGRTPGSARMDVGRLGEASSKRGTTFGYADVRDPYPTLAQLADGGHIDPEDMQEDMQREMQHRRAQASPGKNRPRKEG